MPNRLLLITYYWPPAGGVAVLRWLQLTWYFAEMGWEVTVYHPRNAAYPSLDSQNREKIHPNIKQISSNIIEPGSVYSKLGQKNNGTQVFTDNTSWWKKLALKIRANLFIPDARMLWIRPSVKFLQKHIENHEYDVVITNGTPHSCHVIGLQLKEKFPEMNWVADFRDPWMEIDYFEELPLTKKAREKHSQLEQQVLRTADIVTTVSPSWAQLFTEKGAKQAAVFTNGYFIDERQETRDERQEILISHVGTLDTDRNPEKLWEALSKEERNLRFELVGPVTQEVQDLELKEVKVTPTTIPHAEAIEVMQNSDALLLLNNRKGAVKGRIPAKLFEYLALGKPIIYFGTQENDAAEILNQSGMAKFYTYEQEVDLAELENWLNHPPKPKTDFAAQFSREQIAKNYSDFLIQSFEL